MSGPGLSPDVQRLVDLLVGSSEDQADRACAEVLAECVVGVAHEVGEEGATRRFQEQVLREVVAVFARNLIMGGAK